MEAGELTITGLLEAVLGVAVARKDHNTVAALLQPHGCVDDQSLGAAYAKVRVEEHDGPLALVPVRHGAGLCSMAGGSSWGCVLELLLWWYQAAAPLGFALASRELGDWWGSEWDLIT